MCRVVVVVVWQSNNSPVQSFTSRKCVYNVPRFVVFFIQGNHSATAHVMDVEEVSLPHVCVFFIYVNVRGPMWSDNKRACSSDIQAVFASGRSGGEFLRDSRSSMDVSTP